jgi:hypothetical protein
LTPKKDELLLMKLSEPSDLRVDPLRSFCDMGATLRVMVFLDLLSSLTYDDERFVKRFFSCGLFAGETGASRPSVRGDITEFFWSIPPR